MPEWEAVYIPVEEVVYSYESSYNELLMPDWESVNEFMEVRLWYLELWKKHFYA